MNKKLLLSMAVIGGTVCFDVCWSAVEANPAEANVQEDHISDAGESSNKHSGKSSSQHAGEHSDKHDSNKTHPYPHHGRYRHGHHGHSHHNGSHTHNHQ
ncbi:MAG: hypothetical protein LBL30_00925 [Holosporales bacterium]|jgi:hypothetical protein|nr:hypothetical protein [Holosporales bacterium]